MSPEGWIDVATVVIATADKSSASYCDAAAKPDSARKCMTSRCGSRHSWRLGPWSNVSTMFQMCLNNGQFETFSIAELCVLCSFDFSTVNSSVTSVHLQCSVACGLGVKQRSLTCVDDVSRPVKARRCPKRYQPETSAACYQAPCRARSCKHLQALTSLERDGHYRLLIRDAMISVSRPSIVQH